MTAIQGLVLTICPTMRCVPNKETETFDASMESYFINDHLTVRGSAQQHQVKRSSQIFLGPSTRLLLFFFFVVVLFFLSRGHHINLGGTKWENIPSKKR